MGPLSKDLFITLYGSLDNFINASSIHPLEEYIISFDEFMADDEMINTIALRMGILIIGGYRTFIDRIVQIIKFSGYTYEEYKKYINMDREEFEKLDTGYNYDDRLFVFIKK